MHDTSERLAERLLSDGQKSLDFFRRLTPNQWEHIIYTDGAQWQVHQVLAHFVSSEQANLQVIEDIVSGGAGAAPGPKEQTWEEMERVLDEIRRGVRRSIS